METSQSHSESVLASADSPYYRINQSYMQTMTHMRRKDPGPEIVSRVIQHAIETGHPKARYLVAVPFTNRLAIILSDSLRDFMLKRFFRI